MKHFIEPIFILASDTLLPDLIVLILAILILIFQKKIGHEEKEIKNKIIKRNRKAIFGCSVAILVITFISSIGENIFHKRLISGIKSNGQKTDTSINLEHKNFQQSMQIGNILLSMKSKEDSFFESVRELPKENKNFGKTTIIQNNSAIDSLNNLKNGNNKQFHSPPICSLTVSRLTINKGESVIISWSNKNNYAFTLTTAGSSPVSLIPLAAYEGGRTTVSPNKTTTYVGTATGPGGTVQSRIIITVNP
jgi:hypothetical protein